jgi:propionyl-CoA carboxylase alpha chain
MFKKILIANRGEIACRVIRSAKQMGIATVAVYSEADAQALHVQMADEAICIGPPASADSYLRADRIIDACRQLGVEAVHPGYGFLSENASFCESLSDAGIVFIGPGVKAINAMGDKITSKRLADEAGVSTVPGFTEVIQNPDQAVEVAQSIGYPVMLKASAGGGGKGMRVVWNDAECREGFERASNEARSSFSDDRIFAEKFIEEPRHIEIQIVADSHGNTVFLGERECSIQRRHQKVIEEAPSPFLDEETRQAMGRQAVALAEAVDYQSAGTVEFIVDAQRNFYFLEMNTRLQVEHPVTEMVTGVDLVELMIRVANGEKLPIAQSDVELTGWAIEARVYAEDPFRNFLPSIGRLANYQAPIATEHVRIDTGIVEGSEVSMYYDPMIAKLVTFGATRDEAIERLSDALDAYYIRGVSHNISFLNALISHPRFREGRLTTNFIADEYPDGFHAEDVAYVDPMIAISVAAMAHTIQLNRDANITGQTRRFERTLGTDWVVIVKGGVTSDATSQAQDEHLPITVNAAGDGFDITHLDSTYHIESQWKIGEAVIVADINGQSKSVQLDIRGPGYRVFHGGTETELLIVTPQAAQLAQHMIAKVAPDMSQFLLSPMPGLLARLNVTVGDEVKAGEEIAIVEAMKMENSLRAEEDGIVAQVLAAEGDSLDVDQPIVEFAREP